MSLQTRMKAPKPLSCAPPARASLLPRNLTYGSANGLARAGEEHTGNQLNLQRRVVNQSAPLTARPGFTESPLSSDESLDARTYAAMKPRFGHDFGRTRVHAKAQAATPSRATNAMDYRAGQNTDGRGRLPEGEENLMVVSDQRPGEGEDPVHQPMLDTFRNQQGQPPGGIDEGGNQVGPSDAEIKYRPQPIAVLNGPFHAPIDEPATVGMEIQITVQSSNGNNASMASVQDSEKVSLSFDHTGSFVGTAPIPSSQSSFMPAVNIPNDRHGAPRALILNFADNHGGNGSFAKHQLDVYTHPHYGIINPIAIPNSGYKITRTITTGPGTRVRLRVDKTPEACTVDGFSTTAGPSPAQHDEVIVRA